MNKLSTIICPHFGACSGCTTNDLPPIWEEMKQFFGDIELEVGATKAWRTKAKLAVNGSKIGLYRAHSHDVVPIPDCHAHHPSINKAVSLLKGIPLQYIQCFVDLVTEKVQLVLSVKDQIPAIPKSDLWHSVWLNTKPQSNRILSDQWTHLSGEPLLWQKLGGRSFPFHPGAFAQAHWTLFEKLALQVVDWVPPNSRLLELYAGIGIMGVLAAPKCASVALIENNPYAHLSFQALNLPIPYHLIDAKDADLQNADCLILDPPRKGLDPALLNKLKTFSGTIIYVSCDFNSFVRDATALIEAGWTIDKAKGYLLFPGTNHVETIARMEK